jgi:hypothetical protein
MKGPACKGSFWEVDSYHICFQSLALTAQWLSERLGQSFIVENRAGAGSTIAAESVARAPPTLAKCPNCNSQSTFFSRRCSATHYRHD